MLPIYHPRVAWPFLPEKEKQDHLSEQHTQPFDILTTNLWLNQTDICGLSFIKCFRDLRSIWLLFK